jgi:hypothetical protein
MLTDKGIDFDGRNLRLTAGVNGTDEMKTGRGGMIDFLLSPTQATTARSLEVR